MVRMLAILTVIIQLLLMRPSYYRFDHWEYSGSPGSGVLMFLT